MVLVLHIYSCFLQKAQIFKSSKWERLQDQVARRAGEQMMERSRGVRGTPIKRDF